MKIKNINIVERHVEKVVLGLAVIAALAILWFYVIGQPYAVTVGSKTDIAPSDVPGVIADSAKQLETRIKSPNSPLRKMPIASYKEAFEKHLYTSPNKNTLAYEVPMGQHGLSKDIGPVFEFKQTDYVIPQPPAPVAVHTRSDFAVLVDPSDAKLLAEITQQIGPQQPRDFRYVSVGGTVQIDEWRKALRAVPQDSRPPEEWWRGLLTVTDVILERRKLDPATKQWGQVEVLPPTPGSISLRSPSMRPTDADAKAMVEQLLLESERIARPPFLTIAPERPWAPPNAAAPRIKAEDLDRYNSLLEDVARINAKIEKLKPSAAGGKGGGVSGELANLNKELHEKQTEIHRIRGPQKTSPVKSDSPEAEDRVYVWAHDITAQPGATYQYRLRVSLYNPAFNRKNLGQKNAAEGLQHKFSVASAESAWSSNVEIDPDIYTFLVGVSPTENRATLEVWRIFDGAWRAQQYNVQPGDVVGRVASVQGRSITGNVDFRTGMTVVDVHHNIPTQQAGASTSRLLYIDKADHLLDRTIDSDRRLRQEFQIRFPAIGASPVAAAGN